MIDDADIWFCFLFIQGRGHQVMNGSVHHNSHDKDENSVTLAMQRITLMGPRYTNRIWLLNNTNTVYWFWLLRDRR